LYSQIENPEKKWRKWERGKLFETRKNWKIVLWKLHGKEAEGEGKGEVKMKRTRTRM
jgi:hypothetical protein